MPGLVRRQIVDTDDRRLEDIVQLKPRIFNLPRAVFLYRQYTGNVCFNNL